MIVKLGILFTVTMVSLLNCACHFAQLVPKSPSFEGFYYVKTMYTNNLDSIKPKDIIPVKKLFLFDDCIVEASVRLQLNSEKAPYFDTTGYYFIDMKRQVYAKYDTFSIKAQQLEYGNLRDKTLGLLFLSKDPFYDVSGLSIRDTAIAGQAYKVASAVRKDSTGIYQLRARIKPQPENFPVQLSSSLSQMTDGGFVTEWTQHDVNKGGASIVLVKFEAEKLPGKVVEIMKKWHSDLPER